MKINIKENYASAGFITTNRQAYNIIKSCKTNEQMNPNNTTYKIM
jgi:hypothetical protein